jgi:hypothetical protein
LRVSGPAAPDDEHNCKSRRCTSRGGPSADGGHQCWHGGPTEKKRTQVLLMQTGSFVSPPTFVNFHCQTNITINCIIYYFLTLNTNTHNTLPSAVAVGYKPNLFEKMRSPNGSNAISDSPDAARQRTRPVQDTSKTPQEKAPKKKNGITICFITGAAKAGCNMRTRPATSHQRACNGSADKLQRVISASCVQRGAATCNKTR